MRLAFAFGLAWFAPALASSAADASRFPAVDPMHLDRTAAPCVDFYHFANGAFTTVGIPDDHSAWGVNEEIDERNDTILREILETAARDGGASGTLQQRLGDFYASGMDEAAIFEGGLHALSPFFSAISGLETPLQLPAMFGRLHRAGFSAGFGFYVAIDDRNSSAIVARLSQGGLGLPERNYYLDDTTESQAIRTAYVAHITRMLTLAGDEPTRAGAAANAIMALETRLATVSRPLDELQDPQTNYHKFQRDELGPKVAPLDWAGYFATVDLPATQTHVIVGQPEFFVQLADILPSTPMDAWRAYLRWQVLDGIASALPRDFEAEHFDFHGRVLSGQQEMKPRWKRVLAAIDAGIGEDLGQLYVHEAFSPEAKAKALELARFTFAAMRIRIARAGWMGDATKDAALRKIDTLRLKIGYPDVWRDYGELIITRNSYVANVLAARAFEFRRKLRQLGQPVDRDEWWMTPQTNNAYFDPSLNEICFPAGILQPPFFDVRADAASNYGAIGATIGHELTHAFDDSGRQYDANGNLRDWWTPEDAAHFEERADFIVRQYDAFEVVPGVHLNGRQTLGENIADIGGLLVAFDAFHLATAGDDPVAVDGFTPDQRFFIAFGQSWRTNMRPQRLRYLATADVHSTPRERVNGTVVNLAVFFRAFGCPVPENLPPSIW